MARYTLCRKLHVDLWGELLTARKQSAKRLLTSIYQPYEKSSSIFLLRIDKLKPRKIWKPLSKFSASKIDKTKLSAFYDHSPVKLRVLIKRGKHLRGDVFQKLLHYFEGQLNVILYRANYCLTTPHARALIEKLPFVIVNNNRFVNPKPGFRIAPYDFLTLPLKSPVELEVNRLLDTGTFRLRDRHLVISYQTSTVFMFDIEPNLLFFYFPFEYGNAFFTPRYH